MSNIKNYYHDEICGQDESNDQGYGDWAYEQMKDRDLDRQLEEEERQQKEETGVYCREHELWHPVQCPNCAVEQQAADADYELISIDYSEKSWQQFSADLLNPESQLMKDLDTFIKGAKSC